MIFYYNLQNDGIRIIKKLSYWNVFFKNILKLYRGTNYPGRKLYIKPCLEGR